MMGCGVADGESVGKRERSEVKGGCQFVLVLLLELVLDERAFEGRRAFE
jgi:hypothetical protein